MTELVGNKIRCGVLVGVCVLMVAMRAQAQNRGVYPLGMSATNSGVTPGPGFAYVNQLLFYSRDHAKDEAGNTLPVTGQNYVLKVYERQVKDLERPRNALQKHLF